jgi:hypothetical protein
MKKVKPVSLWDNNEIQFARLLCELVANWEDDTCAKQTIRAVASSMDLTYDQVNELFDRAEVVWEASKAKHCKVRR